MSAAEPHSVSGEIIGFRQWRVTPDLELRAVAFHETWWPGPNRAGCHADSLVVSPAVVLPHVPPHPDCECGLYALHAPTFWYGNAGARKRVAFFEPEPDVLYVAGLVAAWGRVEVHHDGFRAEHARVVALAVPERRREAVLARALAADYSVPTVPQPELERVASEFGDLVPKDLRPDRNTYRHSPLGPVFPLLPTSPPAASPYVKSKAIRAAKPGEVIDFQPKRRGGRR